MKLNKYITFLFLAVIALTSCKKRGCTDYEALNYDPEAKEDDNTCYYFWIGQNYQGGKIFYIDRSRKHGLIASDKDIDGLHKWSNSIDSITVSGINNTEVGTGASNSKIIYDIYGSNSAAGLCMDLVYNGFDDWYLPSMEEMRGLSLGLGTVGQADLGSNYYWTSSQFSSTHAWTVYQSNETPVSMSKNLPLHIRPIRSF